MRKVIAITVLLIAITIFSVGCSSANRNHCYQQKIMALEAQLAKSEQKSLEKKDMAVAEDHKNDQKIGAKKIPIEAMKKRGERKETVKKKITAYSPKKVLSWTDRIKQLEEKVARHDRQIVSNTRRLSRLERVMNRMGTALQKVIKKAGGIKNIKEAIVGPFGYNSSEVTDEMAAQIAVFCKEYKKAANGSQTGKKLFINIKAFADKNGSPEYNQKLSQKRAKAVVPFFKKELAGIAFEISAKGAGETDEGFTDSNARVIKVTHDFKDIKRAGLKT